MSAALNSVVKAYLDETYPRAAKALAKEAPLDDAQRRRVYGSQSIQALILKHATHRLAGNADSSDDDAPPKKSAKASPKTAPRKAPIPDSSSSEDDEPVRGRPAAARKVSPKPSPRVAPKKAPIPDSSDSDDDERVRAPAAKKPGPKAAAAVKAPVVDSDSEEDEPVRNPVAKKASPKASPKAAAAKKAPVVDSDSSDDDAPVVKRPAPGNDNDSDDDDDAPIVVNGGKANHNGGSTAHKAARHEGDAAGRKGPANLNPDGTYKRFQRIDPTKVTFTNDALRDNRPGQEHLTLRQNQEMMRVKGKGFNKLKQKNKAKFYGAGVDLSVRSFQFPDSDDD